MDLKFASMRPRVFPAEDPTRDSMPDGPCGSFNEAAGIPRGRHTFTYEAKYIVMLLQ